MFAPSVRTPLATQTNCSSFAPIPKKKRGKESVAEIRVRVAALQVMGWRKGLLGVVVYLHPMTGLTFWQFFPGT